MLYKTGWHPDSTLTSLKLKLFTWIFLLFPLLFAALLDQLLNQGILQHLHALQCPPNNLITILGIVKFDSVRMDEICTALGPGVIVSNQIQVISSLWHSPTETLII